MVSENLENNLDLSIAWFEAITNKYNYPISGKKNGQVYVNSAGVVLSEFALYSRGENCKRTTKQNRL